MDILLLGGTGAMGSHLTELLAENPNNDITVTSRKMHTSRSRVNYVCGDAHDPQFLDHLLRKHWNAIFDFMVYDTAEFESRANALLRATDQYIYLSSSRVYADASTPITESSPRLLDTVTDAEYLGTDEYALTKARQENVLFASENKNWTIIRPYITYAENRLQLGVLELEAWLPRALQGRSIVFSDDIACKITTMTYGRDVAYAMSCLVKEPSALSRVFHITCPQSLPWSRILEIYMAAIVEKTGMHPSVKMIEHCPNLKNPAQKYQVLYDRHYNRKFETDAVSAFCDPTAFLGIEKGLKKCIYSYIDAHPDFESLPLDPYQNALYDRIASEYTPRRYFKTNRQYVKYCLFRYMPMVAALLARCRSFIR